MGDLDINHTSCIYDNGSVRRIHVTNTVGTSAGGFYGAITRILGFRELRHEGKVIGLAAYGNPAPLYEAFSRALRLSADGNTLDSDFAGQHERVRYDYLASVAAGHSRENISTAAQQVLKARNGLHHGDGVPPATAKVVDGAGPPPLIAPLNEESRQRLLVLLRA